MPLHYDPHPGSQEARTAAPHKDATAEPLLASRNDRANVNDRPSEPRDRSGSVSAALHLLTTVGSPAALGTALLVYYGWVRTSRQAERLGFDVSIMDLSVQDYLLKSVNVLYLPLIILLFVTFALHQVHLRVVIPTVDRSLGRPLQRYAVQAIRHSWLLWLTIGLTVALFTPSLDGFVIPGILTLTCLCLFYAASLDRRAYRPALHSTTRWLILLILAFAVFWDTERIARIMGDSFAIQIAAEPEKLVSVTVYSPKSLNLSVPGVTETKLAEPDSAYSFKYEGMRLVQRSGNRYFLITDRWDLNQPRVLLLRESDTVRLEFSRQPG